MAKEDQRPTGVDPFTGYRPTRPARLRGTGREPPPVPVASPICDGFGAADEDGLRILAALETLTSLEPDYCPDNFEDLTAEASVTIIEVAGADAAGEVLDGGSGNRPPGDQLGEARTDPQPGLLLDGYEAFLGAGEEAMVEIVEIDPSSDPAHRTTRYHAPQAASLGERLAAVEARSGRFLRALFGN